MTARDKQRIAAAKNPQTPVDVLESLASDPEDDVRIALAKNPSTTPALLTRLAGDSYYRVREAIASRRNAPLEALLVLAPDTDSDVERALAANPDLPVEMVEELARVDSYRARVLAAGHRLLSLDSLRRLTRDRDSDVRAAAMAQMAALRATGVDVEPPIEAELTVLGTVRGDPATGFALELDGGAAFTLEAGASEAALVAGDRAAIHGPTRTYRSGKRVMRAERVVIVGDGGDAAAIGLAAPAPAPQAPATTARARAPFDLRLRVLAGLGAGLVVVGLVLWRGVVAGQFPVGPTLVESGAVFAILALAMWLSRDPFEATEAAPPGPTPPPENDEIDDPEYQAAMRALAQTTGGTAVRPPFEIGWAAIALGTVALIGVLVSNVAAVDSGPFAAAFGPFSVALAGLLLVLVVRRHPRQLRLARLLRRAGTSIEGVVEAGGVVVSRTVPYQRLSSSRTESYTTQDGKSGTRTVTTSWLQGQAQTTPLEPFRIRAADRMVQVVGGRATWGAPLHYRPEPTSRGGAVTTHAAIASGDSVVVVGAIGTENGIPTIRSTGPDTVVLFGARDHARATLARLMQRWHLVMLALLAINVAAIVLGIVLATARVAAPPPADPPDPAPRLDVPAERL